MQPMLQLGQAIYLGRTTTKRSYKAQQEPRPRIRSGRRPLELHLAAGPVRTQMIPWNFKSESFQRQKPLSMLSPRIQVAWECKIRETNWRSTIDVLGKLFASRQWAGSNTERLRS